MTYPAKHVANSILSARYGEPDLAISPMKLQKLMYFVHGWHLAVHGDPAVDGGFVAWPFGPVNVEIYHEFKSYGDKPIRRFATEFSDQGETVYVVAARQTKFFGILNMVKEKYGHLSATTLSELTHAPGSPWKVTPRLQQIDDTLVKRHFIGQVNTSARNS